jgi:glycine cleavage system H protein
MDEFRPQRAGMRYTADDLWLRRDGGQVVIGVTDRVSRILTLVNSVELPVAGQRLDAAEELATVDSQKADITVSAPCPLKILAVNEELASDPMRVRMDPYDGGWLVRAELPAGAWEELLDEEGYRELVAQRG